MSTITVKFEKKFSYEFSDIPLGEFFVVGSRLYFKYSVTHCFDVCSKKSIEMKMYDPVYPTDVEIIVK